MGCRICTAISRENGFPNPFIQTIRGATYSCTPNKAGRTDFLTERRYKWAVGYAQQEAGRTDFQIRLYKLLGAWLGVALRIKRLWDKHTEYAEHTDCRWWLLSEYNKLPLHRLVQGELLHKKNQTPEFGISSGSFTTYIIEYYGALHLMMIK